VLVWLPDTTSCYMVCTHIHFEKAEAAYCRHRLGHHTTVLHGAAAHRSAAWCSCTPQCCMVQLHIAVVYFTEYFSMLLSASSAYICISMNCTENVTDGYQALLSNFTENLGTRVSLLRGIDAQCTCRYWGSICLAQVFSASFLVGMVTHGTEKIYSRGDKNTNSHLSHCQLGHSGMFTLWSKILLSDLNWRRWAGVRATVAWRARVYWLLHTWGANVTNSHATKLCSHLQVLIWVPEDISQPTNQPTMVVRIFFTTEP